jgi:hypothetical protein
LLIFIEYRQFQIPNRDAFRDFEHVGKFRVHDHQVAQKSTSTTLPLYLAADRALPQVLLFEIRKLAASGGMNFLFFLLLERLDGVIRTLTGFVSESPF